MSDELPPSSRFKISWLIGIAAAFAIFALIAAYSSRMTNDYPSYDRGRGQARYETLAKVQSAENALIEPVDDQGKPTATWVDQTKGTVRISIEEAMAKEVDTLKSQPMEQGSEIPGAAPAPPPAPPAPAAPAAGTTNAAPATPANPAKKPVATGAKTPPAAPNKKVRPPSGAASTASPTVPEPSNK